MFTIKGGPLSGYQLLNDKGVCVKVIKRLWIAVNLRNYFNANPHAEKLDEWYNKY